MRAPVIRLACTAAQGDHLVTSPHQPRYQVSADVPGGPDDDDAAHPAIPSRNPGRAILPEHPPPSPSGTASHPPAARPSSASGPQGSSPPAECTVSSLISSFEYSVVSGNPSNGIRCMFDGQFLFRTGGGSCLCHRFPRSPGGTMIHLDARSDDRRGAGGIRWPGPASRTSRPEAEEYRRPPAIHPRRTRRNPPSPPPMSC